ncbi:diacylglycerol/lipid kinase family protein [Microterricola viridarii]|uniref:diacylglycerol/lipid kinase family protein n=1 Tax=Microterricola viridarii TaxID=412690 RepID=UPI0013665765|nr:diacylglycerol kinase family protein [Microterricola viridarii]
MPTQSAPDDAAPVPAAKPRAAIVYNPSKSGVDELKKAVRQAEKDHGWGPSVWLETEVDDPGRSMAEKAVAMRVPLVIAAGGDGTVRSVAEGLRGTGTAMGIVPAGTGNLLARNLEIPVNDVALALEIAFAGAERRIDALLVDVTRPGSETERHVSLVMSGVGIDAAMISNTDPELKKRVGWLAYVNAGLRILPMSKPFHLHYRMEGRHSHRVRVATVLVANLGVLPGNIELIPDAVLDDGLLDVAVLQPKNAWGWLMIWRRVAWENRVLRKTVMGRQLLDLTGGDKRSEMVYLRGTGIELRIEEGVQELEIDGDEFGFVTAVGFSTDAGALLMRVPKES